MEASVPARVTRIAARSRRLGGVAVARVLPSSACRMVGPFIFLDHFGPVDFAPGQGIDVAPHPHIGLATVTYLFEGSLLHRDSLGSMRRIEAGDVNWMSAGRGIAHSERTADSDRRKGLRLHGIQSWVALPRVAEQGDPSFAHYPCEDLPAFDKPGARLRLIAGSAYGKSAPVRTLSPLFYLDVTLEAGASLPLPDEHAQRAVYLVEGDVEVASGPGAGTEAGTGAGPGAGSEGLPEHSLAVLPEGAAGWVKARAASRVMLLGGAPLESDRFIWWNFVASDRALIEEAKRDWAEGRFPSVPGESDRQPLPPAP